MATHPVPVVNFVTINENKVLEARAILEPNIDVHHLALKLEEIQGSMEEICNAKCRRATEAVNGPALVEDTALCFNALHGLPGPYIKPFLEHLGPDGLNKLLEPYEDKSAKAVSMFAYSAGPGHAPVLFQGINNGKIVLARGNTGFGWDAIFEYEGKTFGEMKPEEKNDISHRGIALAEVLGYGKAC